MNEEGRIVNMERLRKRYKLSPAMVKAVEFCLTGGSLPATAVEEGHVLLRTVASLTERGLLCLDKAGTAWCLTGAALAVLKGGN